ncbi:MAG: hypothetical protein JXR10_01600 [Cyclobacteriaceae bacterium]
MKQLKIVFVFFFLISSLYSTSQILDGKKEVIEVGESLEEYIKENHVDEIEEIVHRFTESRMFLNYLLEKGHHINADTVKLKRRDIRIGSDIDVYVKHFTEHQNFTMIMVPVDIYPLVIYDTLLFSVLEVSDEWLREKFYYHDLSDERVKSDLLSLENHELITKHMYDQVMKETRQGSAEVEVRLHESYITTNSIHLNTHELGKDEKAQMLRSWSIFKKLLSHNLDLNVEMNIYIFGHDDMNIIILNKDEEEIHRITPSNIFTRHHFEEE